MLTESKGGTCSFLGEECCHDINKTVQIQTSINKFQNSIKTLQTLDLTSNSILSTVKSLLLPLVTPLLLLLVVLLFGPCLLRLLMDFINKAVQTATNELIGEMLLLKLKYPNTQSTPHANILKLAKYLSTALSPMGTAIQCCLLSRK